MAKGKLGKGNHSGRQGKGNEREGGGGGGGGGSEEDDVNMVDVNESLRGALRRIAYAGEKMKPLPAGCSFTLAVELRDKALAPISVSVIPSLSNIHSWKLATHLRLCI